MMIQLQGYAHIHKSILYVTDQLAEKKSHQQVIPQKNTQNTSWEQSEKNQCRF